MNKVSYVRKEDVLDLIDEIQKETDTFSLIQLAFLKERINNKLMEFDERFIFRSKVIDKVQDEFRLLVHDYNFLKPCLDQQELIDRYNYLIHYIIDRIYEESNNDR